MPNLVMTFTVCDTENGHRQSMTSLVFRLNIVIVDNYVNNLWPARGFLSHGNDDTVAGNYIIHRYQYHTYVTIVQAYHIVKRCFHGNYG